MQDELVELNRIRLDEDKSYAELAEEIGIKEQSTLNRILRGIRTPTDRTLHKIRKYLDARKPTTSRQRKAG